MGGPVPLEPRGSGSTDRRTKSSSKTWQRGVEAHAHTPRRGYEKREGRGGREGGRGKAVQWTDLVKQVFRFRRNSHLGGRPGPGFQGIQRASYHVQRFNLCLTI